MLDLLPVHGQVLAFVRRHAEQTLLCAFNCSAEPVAWALPEGLHPARLCTASGASGARLEGRTLHFEPHGVAIALLP
jgi:alpha-glucosidase